MVFIRLLIWDILNVGHIARHEIIPEEVEQVCHGDFVSGETYRGRIRVIGPTSAGRILTIILAPQGHEVYHPVTARPASRKERRRYGELKGGELS